MYRGTTPTHVFTNLPVSKDEISDLRISYAQKGKEVFCISMQGVKFIADDALELTLDQSSTLSFTKGRVQIQMRILLSDGTALASEIVTLPVGEILRGERLA